MKIKNKIIAGAIIVAAVLVGVFHDYLASLAFFVLITAGIIQGIRVFSDKKDRTFLIGMVAVILVLRMAAAVLFTFYKDGVLSQDEGLYSKKAFMQVYQRKGVDNATGVFSDFYDDRDMLNVNYGNNVFTSGLSWFYQIFGYETFSARMINVFMFILAFIVYYCVVYKVFGEMTAKLSSAIFGVFPSLAVWSIMVGIDSFVLFLIVTAIFFIMLAVQKKNLFILVPAFAVALIIKPIRLHVAIVLMGCIAVTFLACVFFLFLNRKGKILSVLILLVVAAFFGPYVLGYIKIHFHGWFNVVVQRQISFARADDSGYLIYPLRCYKYGIISFWDMCLGYFKGMMYTFFSPFPWDIKSTLQLVVVPQMAIWYFICLFALRGAWLGIRRKGIQTLVLLTYILGLTSILALAGWNIGAMFRHRDMVSPFVFVLFAYGIQDFLNYSANKKTEDLGA